VRPGALHRVAHEDDDARLGHGRVDARRGLGRPQVRGARLADDPRLAGVREQLAVGLLVVDVREEPGQPWRRLDPREEVRLLHARHEHVRVLVQVPPQRRRARLRGADHEEVRPGRQGVSLRQRDRLGDAGHG
jgi:hypothetical protein